MKNIQRSTKLKTDEKTISQNDESDARTKDVLSDKDIMNQIKQGKKKNVKVRDFKEVADELDL